MDPRLVINIAGTILAVIFGIIIALAKWAERHDMREKSRNRELTK